MPNRNTIDYLRDIGVLATTKFHSLEGSTLEKFLSEKEIEDCKINFTIPKKLEKVFNRPKTGKIFVNIALFLYSQIICVAAHKN